ncbi:hypothetical protein Pcinc_000657 [Petrolisthes cinctipes]|uniref:Transmembrane protein n=1 Tax=Petrolisthes cinctipes TaxID=88211 RepID=A0AAE1L3X8_PETCI|nr:hypothetical protein Pcinc_000657 [Petrolisthes cinctipes]
MCWVVGEGVMSEESEGAMFSKCDVGRRSIEVFFFCVFFVIVFFVIVFFVFIIFVIIFFNVFSYGSSTLSFPTDGHLRCLFRTSRTPLSPADSHPRRHLMITTIASQDGPLQRVYD